MLHNHSWFGVASLKNKKSWLAVMPVSLSAWIDCDCGLISWWGRAPLGVTSRVISVSPPPCRRHLATTSYWTWLRMGSNCCSTPQTRDLRCFCLFLSQKFSNLVTLGYALTAFIFTCDRWLKCTTWAKSSWNTGERKTVVVVVADWCLKLKAESRLQMSEGPLVEKTLLHLYNKMFMTF